MAGWTSQTQKLSTYSSAKIRKKLQVMGVDDFIETNWGRGYMVIDHRQDPSVSVAPGVVATVATGAGAQKPAVAIEEATAREVA